jgi:hypothetical protein
MPRHNNPESVRCVQVSITIRARDLTEWRAEANRLQCSLAKIIWMKARANTPLPSEGHMACAEALNRVGLLLNQAVRRLHIEGASAEAVEDTLRAVVNIREQLERVP